MNEPTKEQVKQWVTEVGLGAIKTEDTVARFELLAELAFSAGAEQIEDVRKIMSEAIAHAISLGTEAEGFLICWNEGNWDGCREYGFDCDEQGART